MDPTTLLASIIQGEGGDSNADLFGVASTIYNRTIGASGYTGPGYGLSALGAATARGQFSAYPNALQTPSPYAMQLAQALQNGTLSSYGNTGNATYYNAAGYAYPSLNNNSYSSASNAYSDIFKKPPSSNFVLPQAGGVTPANTNGDYLTMNPSDPNYGDITGLSVAGVNAPLGSQPGTESAPDFADLPDDTFDQNPAPSIIGNDQGTPNLGGGITQAQAGQGGTPLPGQQNTGEASVAGQDVQKGLGTAGTDVENASGGITGTLASAVNSLEQYTSSAFVVIALVVVGLIFIAYGLGMFGKRELATLASMLPSAPVSHSRHLL